MLITVTVVEARNLFAITKSGKRSPMVRVMVGNDTRDTKAAPSSVQPAWNQSLSFEIVDPKKSMCYIEMTEKAFMKTHFLGKLNLSLAELATTPSVDAWYTLTPKKQGDEVTGELRIVLSAGAPPDIQLSSAPSGKKERKEEKEKSHDKKEKDSKEKSHDKKEDKSKAGGKPVPPPHKPAEKKPLANHLLTADEDATPEPGRSQLIRERINACDHDISELIKSRQGVEMVLKFGVGHEGAAQAIEEINSDITQLESQKEALRTLMASSDTGDASYDAAAYDAAAYGGAAGALSQAQALYDYTGSSEAELSFSAGEVISVTQKPEGEWWYGDINGRAGYFPYNYVQEL
mmetsp:Transcript_31514/g.79051  ORF Transcript_31514/g.79051 Transcript_31514/m.79051 type:complete len:347 (+) Transcript_31514:69-1109(+)